MQRGLNFESSVCQKTFCSDGGVAARRVAEVHERIFSSSETSRERQNAGERAQVEVKDGKLGTFSQWPAVEDRSYVSFPLLLWKYEDIGAQSNTQLLYIQFVLFYLFCFFFMYIGALPPCVSV